jgi:hypothetical protein
MATITTILASDIIASSRVTLNTNFANLNTDKVDINSTYADPAWITSLAGSKITGNIGGNAATATALATARTIAGVSFDGTANIAIPSTGLSDSSDIVRGASSVASHQVLYGTGAGVAGSDTNFRYFVGTGTMVVGATTESGVGGRLQVAGNMSIDHRAGSANATIVLVGRNAGVAATTAILANQLGGLVYNAASGANLGHDFQLNGVTQARLTNINNLLLGTTTDDGTNRLQVAGNIIVNAGNALRLQNAAANQFASMSLNASSIVTLNYPLSVGPSSALTSDVTLGVHNGTPTTGVTQLIVRAGAGQSTTNLQTWQNSGGTQVAAVTSVGDIYSLTLATTGNQAALTTNGIELRSAALTAWSSTTSWAGSKDLSLSRASANTLQVGDGGSNANGGLFASSIGVGVTPSIAANVNQVIIRAGSAQSTTNLTTWQNSGGTALAGITGAGSFFTGNNANATGDSLIDANGLRFGSTVLVRWSNNLPVNAADISLSRAGVNIGQFGDGGSNSNGLLYLKGVRPVGSTVANLPTASGNTGMIATVTDANSTTIGTTVAGGGGNTVLVWSNGTNWRIYAN